MHVITKTKLSFSDALTYAKARNGGIRISREGWNGKGMYLVYFSPVANGLVELTVLDNDEGGTTLPLRPFLLMKDATNCYVPWLASQTDMIDDDWCVFEDEATLRVETEEECRSGLDEEPTESGEDESDSYRLFKSFNEIINLLITNSNPEKIKVSKIPSGQNEKFKNLADEISKLAKNGSEFASKGKDEEDLDLENIQYVDSKKGKKILHDFLTKHLFQVIDEDITGLIKKLEEKKAEAEHREAQNNLYKNQTLFNTFFCTDPEIYIPDTKEIDTDLLRELSILLDEANTQGYRFIQFMDGKCIELIDNGTKIIVKK
jgi:hypothetical protein